MYNTCMCFCTILLYVCFNLFRERENVTLSGPWELKVLIKSSITTEKTLDNVKVATVLAVKVTIL